jgi:hypothetical protein
LHDEYFREAGIHEEPAMRFLMNDLEQLASLVAALSIDLGGPGLLPHELGRFRARSNTHRNRLRLVLIACWLLHDEYFREAGIHEEPAMRFLMEDLEQLASLVAADLFNSDPDRREELVRCCLRALGLRPKGETEKQAADRLQTLDTTERAKVLADIKASEKRARELREEMERKRAQEAASRYSRE